MNRFIQTWTWRLALGLALVLGFVPVAAARPTQQAADPVTVVNAFNAAWQKPDAEINLVAQGG